MHARDKRAAHASGTHVGERTAERNDNGYGYCGPLESWASRRKRIRTQPAVAPREFIENNTSRNISATQVSYFIVGE